jgi:hypothetical protein
MIVRAMYRTSFLLVASTLLLGACQQQKGPEYASSAESPSYAERYPKALAAVRTRFAEDEKRASEQGDKFASFPGELSEPDWTHVGGVVERADEAGNSADFVLGMQDVETVTRFYESERDEIRQKVIGAANYAKKEKNCDVELSGPIAGSLDKAIELQSEEWLRSRNPAHRYIEDNEEALGKKNIEKLEDQADQIALASYLVRVRMPRAKQDLEAMVADASSVKSTLEAEQKTQKAIADDPKSSKAAKDRANERISAAQAALTTIDEEVNQANSAATEVEQRAKAALDRYQKALDALKEAIDTEAEKKPKT